MIHTAGIKAENWWLPRFYRRTTIWQRTFGYSAAATLCRVAFLLLTSDITPKTTEDLLTVVGSGLATSFWPLVLSLIPVVWLFELTMFFKFPNSRPPEMGGESEPQIRRVKARIQPNGKRRSKRHRPRT